MFGRGRFGFGPWREHLFERGDLKYVILDLLKDKPRHGYEIIRALEERFGGFYTPSPGAVYPTLQMLEDMGYVAGTEQDGKKVYAITEAGRQFLVERRGVVDDISDRMKDWLGPEVGDELREIRREMHEFGHLLKHQARGRWADPQKLRRIREVIARARKDVEAIVEEKV